MARPITLFTGHWADLPLAEPAPLAHETARAAKAFGVAAVFDEAKQPGLAGAAR